MNKLMETKLIGTEVKNQTPQVPTWEAGIGPFFELKNGTLNFYIEICVPIKLQHYL